VSAVSPFTWTLPKGVRLHAAGLIEAGSGLPAVRVPPHVLMQAAFNLVQNAAQALGQRNAANPGAEPTGNIWITASLRPAPPGTPSTRAEGAVYLTVRDDGPGMDAGTVARCTEAFFTTKAKDHGTGLGLFLVRTAVERHGGRLFVASKVGEGSSFTLILRAVAAEASVPSTPTSRTPVAPSP
jgi:signal transduction histidine kinase